MSRLDRWQQDLPFLSNLSRSRKNARSSCLASALWLVTALCVVLLLERVPVAQAGSLSPAIWRYRSPSKRTHLDGLSLVRRSKSYNMPGTDTLLPARENATAAVIYVHGLGSDAEHMYAMIEPMQKTMPHVNFVMPNAEVHNVTAVAGLGLFAWFDMKALINTDTPNLPTHEDEKLMRASINRIHSLIDDQIALGISSERIIVGGFSQGCVVAMLALLSSPRQLGGMFCQSGWLGLTEHLEKKKGKTLHMMQNEKLKPVPVWYSHGDWDTTVPKTWSQQSQQLLRDMGYTDIEVHDYPNLGHWVIPEETADLEAWIAHELPPL